VFLRRTRRGSTHGCRTGIFELRAGRAELRRAGPALDYDVDGSRLAVVQHDHVGYHRITVRNLDGGPSRLVLLDVSGDFNCAVEWKLAWEGDRLFAGSIIQCDTDEKRAEAFLLAPSSVEGCARTDAFAAGAANAGIDYAIAYTDGRLYYAVSTHRLMQRADTASQFAAVPCSELSDPYG
jgi:hypothetical protein